MMNAKMFTVNFDSAMAHEADLSGATLDVSTMRGTDFTHAKLVGASLYAVIIQGVNFTDADLTRVRIIGAAQGAIFVRAKLDHADLGADPRNQPMGVMRTDLTSSDLSGADLTGANLRKSEVDARDAHGREPHGLRLCRWPSCPGRIFRRSWDANRSRDSIRRRHATRRHSTLPDRMADEELKPNSA